MLTVLYDGWPLIYQPNSPSALHLLTLFSACPPGIQQKVIVPAAPPGFLPDHVEAISRPVADTAKERFFWEQRLLPRLIMEGEAHLLHLTTSNPALFGAQRTLISQADFDEAEKPRGFYARAREACGRGGMARLRGLLWPADMDEVPPHLAGIPLLNLPAVVHPGFTSRDQGEISGLQQLDLPETFILYHGPGDKRSLQRLLDAWSWAAGPLGIYYPLLLLGLNVSQGEGLLVLLDKYGLGESVRVLPTMPLDLIPYVYGHASALLHPVSSVPWGSPLRFALAMGTPAVAYTDPRIEALVGPAAYLAPPGDARALGAGVITVIVQEGVGDELSQSGLQRASAWKSDEFRSKLGQIYRAVAN